MREGGIGTEEVRDKGFSVGVDRCAGIGEIWKLIWWKSQAAAVL